MARLPSSHRRGDVVRWTAFVVWLMLAVTAPWSEAVADASDPVWWTATVWGWAGWVLVVQVMLVPSPISLTATHMLAPLAVLAAIVSSDPISMVASAMFLVAVFSADFADRMVQGSAYGRETRFCLRTPVPHMVPAVVAWTLLVGGLIGGSLLVAAGNLVVGVPLVVAGAVLAARTPKRLHGLARRWLVVVPAGLVVHDHLVLAETVMARRQSISSLAESRETGEEADLTGGVLGRRLVVALADPEKVILSDITARMLDTVGALHVRAFAVAPRRVGAALAALRGG
jgi:hypothetical protein